MTCIKEILLAVIVGGGGDNNEVCIGIGLFTVQCGGQVQVLLCQILLNIIILYG